jgi:hypothetical protein
VKNVVPNLLEGMIGPSTGNESAMMIAKGKINPPQFREEITIQNSDSGKGWQC